MTKRNLVSDQKPFRLSVIVPMCNEAGNLAALFDRLLPTLKKITPDFEIICVDDGSRDATLARLKALNASEPRIKAIALSRNFGKEVAIAAGLKFARGDAAVILDADLQHPPELILEFVKLWRDGNQIVYGIRRDRSSDNWLRRTLTHAFYRLFATLSPTDLPEGAGDFRLLDRRAVDALNAMPERARFTKGLYAWIGFRSAGVLFDMHWRADQTKSRWSCGKLFSFALDGLTAFSTMPLRIWSYVGVAISLLALIYAAYVLFDTLIRGIDVPGFPSLIISVMFFSGVQLISLGVLGEYLGRIFLEVKRRPLYFVSEEIGFDPQAENIHPFRPTQIEAANSDTGEASKPLAGSQ